jgi:hypothetical protein
MHTYCPLTLAAAILVVAAAPATAQMAAPPQVHNRALSTLAEGGRQVFRLDARDGDGVAWWPDVAFSTGTIELDVRGRNVPQGSFVGVAFHGADPATYEAVYFRPFNFRSDDPARRSRAVQYISHPDHPWQRLREHVPGAYEQGVVPAPDPEGWFHVTVRVAADTVSVFVGRAASPALQVKRLTHRDRGWVGLWVGNTSPGDFANVRIVPDARPAAAPAPRAGTDLSGTYAGQLLPEGDGDGEPRPGRIVIVDRGETIDVTLGPGVEEMFPASRVSRAGNTLTIEADAPSDTPNHLRLEVTIAGDALTGRLVQTRDGQTRRARIDFTRR